MLTPERITQLVEERECTHNLYLKEIDKLKKDLKEADTAWQASQSRRAHICQLLGVDYTCEEPKTCEQVIEELLKVSTLDAFRRGDVVKESE